jgi:hypothetical protein
VSQTGEDEFGALELEENTDGTRRPLRGMHIQLVDGLSKGCHGRKCHERLSCSDRCIGAVLDPSGVPSLAEPTKSTPTRWRLSLHSLGRRLSILVPADRGGAGSRG